MYYIYNLGESFDNHSNIIIVKVKYIILHLILYTKRQKYKQHISSYIMS